MDDTQINTKSKALGHKFIPNHCCKITLILMITIILLSRFYTATFMFRDRQPLHLFSECSHQPLSNYSENNQEKHSNYQLNGSTQNTIKQLLQHKFARMQVNQSIPCQQLQIFQTSLSNSLKENFLDKNSKIIVLNNKNIQRAIYWGVWPWVIQYLCAFLRNLLFNRSLSPNLWIISNINPNAIDQYYSTNRILQFFKQFSIFFYNREITDNLLCLHSQSAINNLNPPILQQFFEEKKFIYYRHQLKKCQSCTQQKIYIEDPKEKGNCQDASPIIKTNQKAKEASFIIENDQKAKEASFVIENEQKAKEASFIIENDQKAKEASFIIENDQKAKEASFIIENDQKAKEASFIIENDQNVQNDSFIIQSDQNGQDDTFIIYLDNQYNSIASQLEYTETKLKILDQQISYKRKQLQAYTMQIKPLDQQIIQKLKQVQAYTMQIQPLDQKIIQKQLQIKRTVQA